MEEDEPHGPPRSGSGTRPRGRPPSLASELRGEPSATMRPRASSTTRVASALGLLQVVRRQQDGPARRRRTPRSRSRRRGATRRRGRPSARRGRPRADRPRRRAPPTGAGARRRRDRRPAARRCLSRRNRLEQLVASAGRAKCARTRSTISRTRSVGGNPCSCGVTPIAGSGDATAAGLPRRARPCRGRDGGARGGSRERSSCRRRSARGARAPRPPRTSSSTPSSATVSRSASYTC